MKTIYKYPIEIQDRQVLTLPKGSEILTVKMQKDYIFLWALVENTEETEDFEILIYGTGHPIEDVQIKYISTIQSQIGSLVFHIFRKE